MGGEGTDMTGVYQAIGELSLMNCRRKFTEWVAQPCSIRCTANHNFKISTSECIWYPPKCAFSRVSHEKFSGPQTPPLAGRGNPSSHPTPLGASILAPKIYPSPPHETKIGTPHFLEQSYAPVRENNRSQIFKR